MLLLLFLVMAHGPMNRGRTALLSLGPVVFLDRGTGDRGPNWTAVSFFCGPDRGLDIFQLAIINHDYISKKILLNVLYYYISLDFVHFF